MDKSRPVRLSITPIRLSRTAVSHTSPYLSPTAFMRLLRKAYSFSLLVLIGRRSAPRTIARTRASPALLNMPYLVGSGRSAGVAHSGAVVVLVMFIGGTLCLSAGRECERQGGLPLVCDGHLDCMSWRAASIA